MENIQKIIDDLLKFTNTKSIFLYGSRARTDFYNESDYEIGVLMAKDEYIGRSEIKNKFNFKGVNIFPFYYEEFISHNPDTPFVKSIYMKEIIEAGKTLAGEKIIENLKPPEIKLLDIIQDLRFNLGYSLAATHSYREGDNINASLHLAKSCLFGTRDYIILKLQKFRIYLKEKYGVSVCYLFIGFIPENQDLYTSLQKDRYILKFKPVLSNNDGEHKGNVDADLVIQAVIDCCENNFDKAVIVTSDGDFYSLVKYLYDKEKLEAVLSPYLETCSRLLKKTAKEKIRFMENLRAKLEYKKKNTA